RSCVKRFLASATPTCMNPDSYQLWLLRRELGPLIQLCCVGARALRTAKPIMASPAKINAQDFGSGTLAGPKLVSTRIRDVGVVVSPATFMVTSCGPKPRPTWDPL